MNSLKSGNISNFLSKYDFEFDNLPDNLKCVKCGSVLKDPCQVPCGCTFCRVCIDEMMTKENKFCPGVSEECSVSSLSQFATDYKANNIILRLRAKCAYNGCIFKCQIVNMEQHMEACMKRDVECPYRELGCKQNMSTAEQMTEHVHQELYSHSEILIDRMNEHEQQLTTLKNTVQSLDIENKALKVKFNFFVQSVIVQLQKQVKDLQDQLKLSQPKPNAPK